MPAFGARDVAVETGVRTDLPIVGSRGPKNGSDPESVTLQFGEPIDAWSGSVVSADGTASVQLKSVTGWHPAWREAQTVRWSQSPAAKSSVYAGATGDNLFRMDSGPAGDDAILSFITAMTPEGPVLQHD